METKGMEIIPHGCDAERRSACLGIYNRRHCFVGVHIAYGMRMRLSSIGSNHLLLGPPRDSEIGGECHCREDDDADWIKIEAGLQALDPKLTK